VCYCETRQKQIISVGDIIVTHKASLNLKPMALQRDLSNQPPGDPSLDSSHTTMKSPVEPSATDVHPDNSNDMTWSGGEHYYEGSRPRALRLTQLIHSTQVSMIDSVSPVEPAKMLLRVRLAVGVIILSVCSPLSTLARYQISGFVQCVLVEIGTFHSGLFKHHRPLSPTYLWHLLLFPQPRIRPPRRQTVYLWIPRSSKLQITPQIPNLTTTMKVKIGNGKKLNTGNELLGIHPMALCWILRVRGLYRILVKSKYQSAQY
jgi:hypothetical protein